MNISISDYSNFVELNVQILNNKNKYLTEQKYFLLGTACSRVLDERIKCWLYLQQQLISGY